MMRDKRGQAHWHRVVYINAHLLLENRYTRVYSYISTHTHNPLDWAASVCSSVSRGHAPLISKARVNKNLLPPLSRVVDLCVLIQKMRQAVAAVSPL